MKSYHKLPCADCGHVETVVVRLSEHSVTFDCSKCGSPHHGSLGASLTVGYRILDRALHELKEQQDNSLAITFSAMAFECELALLHRKWVGIDELMDDRDVEDRELDERLRRYRTIADKIHAVACVLHPQGIDAFVAGSPELVETLGRFPSVELGKLAEGFQRTVFWPRNRVLHYAETGYTEEDASRVLSIAALGLRILADMDAARRELFDQGESGETD